MSARWMSLRVVLGLALVAGVLAPGAADASVSFLAITSPGPLSSIAIGADLSCQIEHAGDDALEFYPPSTVPGDCGTFLAVGGSIYGPNFAAHDGSATWSLTSLTPFTPVSQSGVWGIGTSADPYTVITVVDTPNGMRVTETDSYVVGEEGYTTTVKVENRTQSMKSFVLYRAGDCFLGGSDEGYGAIRQTAGIACTKSPNDDPAGRFEEWIPITSGSKYLETDFDSVWAWINTGAPFPNTCECSDAIDNGAGLSWNFTLGYQQSIIYAHLTRFNITDSTQLLADPAVAKVVPGADVYLPSLRATLTDAATEEPVWGETITFSQGATTLCSAVTDDQGVAECRVSIPAEVGVVLAGGYHASYAGAPLYGPSEDDAPLLVVAGREL